MDPFTIFAVGASAFGSVLGGMADKAQGDYQAKLDKIDGKIALEDSKIHAKLIRNMATKQRGEATAAYAASGVDVNSQSAVAADHEIMANSERDAEFALLTGERQNAAAKRNAKLSNMSGNSGLLGGVLGGVGKAVGGLSKLF